MALVQLSLLGTPRIIAEGEAVAIGRRKALALLAYLAVTEKPQRREHLLALLWPEYDPAGGRASLRRDLAAVRKVIGADYVASDRQQITMAPSPDLKLDVVQFRALLADVANHSHPDLSACSECAARLDEAAALYQGELLQGFTLPDAPDFDEWLYFEREELRSALARTLQTLLSYHSQGDDYDAAIAAGRRWLALDPLHEPAHQALMRVYALAGHHGAALRQFEECKRILADELDTAVSPDTAALHEQIQRRPFRPASENPLVESGKVVESVASDAQVQAERFASTAGIASKRYNLPAQPTVFIGREEELATLENLFAAPTTRLITIVGPGGMGKTRLVLALGERLLAKRRFAGGVYFIPLAPLSGPDQIVGALAEALDFQLESGGVQTRTPRQQVLDYLAEKQMLLLLDNFEHLLDGADFVAEILTQAPGISIAITSRERLQLQAEQLYPLGGLEFPDWETPEDAIEYTAVRLFLQSANRIRPYFQLGQADLTYLSRICRLVGGMPLAVELAAGWIDMLSLADIAAEIQGGLDILASEARDRPERHRSMRAVFDTAWSRLESGQQAILAQLAYFRGGFTRAAARQVTGATLRQLAALTSKSLLQYVAEGDRYQIHELLRQYSAAQLADVKPVATSHSQYYLGLAAEQLERLKGAEQPASLALLAAEIDNLRLAWARAAVAGSVSDLAGALDTVGYYHEWRGLYDEGLALINVAQQRFIPATQGDSAKLAIMLSTWEGVFLTVLADIPRAEAVLTDCRQRLDALERQYVDVRREKAVVLLRLANIFGMDQSKRHFVDESLALYRELSDLWGLANALASQGYASLHSDTEWAEVDASLLESLTHFRQLGHQWSIARVLEWLANSARYQGNFVQAEAYAQECLQICRDLDGRANLAFGLESMGMTSIHLGRLAEACQLLEEALVLNHELNNVMRIQSCRHRLGMALALVGEQEKPIALHQAIEKSYEERNAPLANRAYLKLALSIVSWAHEPVEQTLQRLEQSVALYEELGGHSTVGGVYAWKAMALQELGHYHAAKRVMMQAIASVLGTRAFILLALNVLPVLIPILVWNGEHRYAIAVDTCLDTNYPLYSRAKTEAAFLRLVIRPLQEAAATPEAAEAQAYGSQADPWEMTTEIYTHLAGLGWA